MDPVKIAVGVLLVVVSVWAIPVVIGLLGMDGSLAYAAVGAIPAFVGGMFFHSGVRE